MSYALIVGAITLPIAQKVDQLKYQRILFKDPPVQHYSR